MKRDEIFKLFTEERIVHIKTIEKFRKIIYFLDP